MTAPAKAEQPTPGSATLPNAPVAAQTARSLLDRPLPVGYREEWAQHFARNDRGARGEDDASEKSRSFMIFRIGEEWLALPAAIFHDVVEPRPVHSLPHRRDALVLGLVNVRGELLVCVSLAQLLHIGQSAPQARSTRVDRLRRMVVIGSEHRRIVFVADEVHGLQRRHESSLLTIPATVSKSASAFTTAMLAWEGRTVGCLDETSVLDMLDRSLA
ncbi:chew domain protein [Labrys miyagiensis]|uniref:Chemotaxis protein CheW n=1 Tax=Labrys miyagiensis TaxID=346912 RepID=A0ABQ6CUF5_9HYPH|nr:chemotaxis protein CheW [Labrys miyagiensis]GLS21876.1 chew domain protein [Labrys miyagiensis]